MTTRHVRPMTRLERSIAGLPPLDNRSFLTRMFENFKSGMSNQLTRMNPMSAVPSSQPNIRGQYTALDPASGKVKKLGFDPNDPTILAQLSPVQQTILQKHGRYIDLPTIKNMAATLKVPGLALLGTTALASLIYGVYKLHQKFKKVEEPDVLKQQGLKVSDVANAIRVQELKKIADPSNIMRAFKQKSDLDKLNELKQIGQPVDIMNAFKSISDSNEQSEKDGNGIRSRNSLSTYTKQQSNRLQTKGYF